MKKIIYIIFILINLNIMISEEINLNNKPKPLSDIEYKFPEYSTEKLSNGLQLYFIEDKEQPTIAFRLLLKAGSIVDGGKAGLSEITSSLLTKGTKSKSSEQISKMLDGVGAMINANSGADNITIYASSLKKHEQLLLDVLSDILINPIFDKDEFEKLQKQMIAGVQYEKSNPSSIAQALSRIVIYGDKHPYAQRNTEESLNSITKEDVKNYYNTWFKPNNATMAVIGDFNKKDVINSLEKFFAKWKSDSIPSIELTPVNSKPKGVYFVSRPNSVQSSVSVTTLTVPFNNMYYERLNLVSNILGAFSGRLFNTLREKYSYTYTPYGFQTRTRFINRFTCGADVATEKTDSSIKVILDELGILGKETPAADEVERMKQYTLGSHLMSMENASYIASLIQNADFQGLKINEISNYPARLNSLTPVDIRVSAKDYFNPEKSYIVVVGDPTIKDKLTQFGSIFEYDLDLNALDGADSKLEEVSLSPEKLIKKYIDAIGGESSLKGVKSLQASGPSEMIINGQVLSGTTTMIKAENGRMYQKADFRIFDQETWVDGTNAWITIQGQLMPIEGAELSKTLFEAKIFSETKLADSKLNLKVLGKNKQYIILSAKYQSGEEFTYYFDVDSYLLKKRESVINTPLGSEIWRESYEEYITVGNVLLPKVIKTSSSTTSTKTVYDYQLNVNVDDSIFKPKE